METSFTPNSRQQQALTLLWADRRRDIYQAVDHQFHVTYTGDMPRHLVPVLTQADVDQLLRVGLIQLKWPEHPTAKAYVLIVQGDGDE